MCPLQRTGKKASSLNVKVAALRRRPVTFDSRKSSTRRRSSSNQQHKNTYKDSNQHKTSISVPSLSDSASESPKIELGEKVRLYEYLPLSEVSHGRLLVLNPGKRNDPIICRIIHIKIEDNPKYEALSYVWNQSPCCCFKTCPAVGPDQVPLDIYIETHDGDSYNINRRLKVTANLYHALRRLRKRGDSRVLWIDQLCVNQDDLMERNQQIQLMTSIYQGARKVWLWLGESGKNSDAALRLIPDIIACMRNLEPGQDFNTDDLYDLPLPWWGDRIWDAIGHLFQRPWWQRTWVLQEAIFASHAIILCGGTKLPFETFEEFISVNGNTGDLSTQILYKVQEPSERAISAIDQVKTIMGWKEDDCRSLGSTEDGQLKYSEASYMTSAMILCRHLEVTDPRDKIFALLGITPRACRELFMRPDYTRSIFDIYREAALIGIHNYQFAYILAEAGRSFQTLDLPSWVPDWTCQKFGVSLTWTNLTNGLRTGQMLASDPSERDESAPTLYRASETSQWKFEYSEEKNCLTVAAKVVGKLVKIGGELEIVPARDVANEYEREERSTLDMAAKIQSCFDMASTCEPCPTGDVITTCERTLLGESYTNLTDDEIRRCFQDYHRWMAIFSKAKKANRPFFMFYTESELKEIEPIRPNFSEVQSAFIYFSQGRAFFTTEDNHMGIGPWSAQPGDLICIILGCPAPFVVRKREDGYYTLMGDSFVTGFMDGEAMKTDEYPVEDISFV